jgi:hypothetical protein
MNSVPSSTGDEAEAFLRTIVPPEEERRLYTSAPWSGGFRWFKSENVIPIERYRRRQVPECPARGS